MAVSSSGLSCGVSRFLLTGFLAVGRKDRERSQLVKPVPPEKVPPGFDTERGISRGFGCWDCRDLRTQVSGSRPGCRSIPGAPGVVRRWTDAAAESAFDCREGKSETRFRRAPRGRRPYCGHEPG